MANIQFELASGRRIGVTAFGEPDAARIVVFAHPAPGASTFDPDPDAYRSRNVHVLAFDRPGYGSSDPLPAGEWPSIPRAAADIAEYLHAMNNAAESYGNHEFNRVGVVGWSAGGRVALALAAEHPHLVDKAVVIATPAPNSEVPWIAPDLSAQSERLAKLSPDEAMEQLTELISTRMTEQLPSSKPDDPVPLGLLGATQADAGALAFPGAYDRLGVMLRSAFRQGPRGLAADILSYTARDWGFGLDHVAAKTLLLYGGADPTIGRDHADWYRDRLPDAEVEVVPGAGHLLIVPQWRRVLDFVA